MSAEAVRNWSISFKYAQPWTCCLIRFQNRSSLLFHKRPLFLGYTKRRYLNQSISKLMEPRANANSPTLLTKDCNGNFVSSKRVHYLLSSNIFTFSCRNLGWMRCFSCSRAVRWRTLAWIMMQIILKEPGIWKTGQEIRQWAMMLPVALLSIVFSFPTFILFSLKWHQACGMYFFISRVKNNKQKNAIKKRNCFQSSLANYVNLSGS